MGDIIVGIDIGTSKVCTLIGKVNKLNQLEILGKSMIQCTGVKKGVIVDIDSTAGSIRNSIERAEEDSNYKIGSAYVNIFGTHVSVVNNRCQINISNENKEITSKDVDRLIRTAGNIPVKEDRQIIDIIPRQYIVDGYDEILDPVGMVGSKLEVDADVVTGKITSVRNILKSIEKAGIKIDGLIAEAFATGDLLLTPEEKDIGVILIDVGGGITDISVIKNRKLLFYDSIPVGGDHITNDLSIGLKVSYSEAEKLKKQFELAATSLIKNDQEVSVFDINENRKKDIKVSEVVEIIEARVYEIFTLCNELLDKNNIEKNCGAGVVLAGGGISYVDGNRQLANEVFDLPVRVGSFRGERISKPEFATAAGIVKFVSGQNKNNDAGSEVTPIKSKDANKEGSFLKKLTKLFNDLF